MRKEQGEERGSVMTALRELLSIMLTPYATKSQNVICLTPVCFIPAYGKDNCDLIAKLQEN